MERREFLKSAVTSAGAVRLETRAAISAVTLGNESAAWDFEWSFHRFACVRMHNRLTGKSVTIHDGAELKLSFSSAKSRIDIPWWKCTFSEMETGPGAGYTQPDFDDSAWGTAANLCLHSLNRKSAPPLPRVRFDGYGWFRAEFTLPEDSRGEEIHIVAGGYDQTDWNEYQIYLNGIAIGGRSASGRWRSPCQIGVSSGTAAYGALVFGPSGRNCLAIRVRGYDHRFSDWSDDVMDRAIGDPVLSDQFVSVGAPYRDVSEFEVKSVDAGGKTLTVELASTSPRLAITLHYELEGPLRRKWVELRHHEPGKVLLLDVQLDGMSTNGRTAEGGYGYPATLEDEWFAAIEHPSGLNAGDNGAIRLTHFPGRRLAPGESWRSSDAVIGAAPAGSARQGFLRYLEAQSPRKSKIVSLYDPFGITAFTEGMNWSLNEEQNLATLDLLAQWQKKGVRFDYYEPDMILDTTADLKQFRLFSFPDGPGKMIERIRQLGMKWGQWFSVTGGTWSIERNPVTNPSKVPRPNSPAHLTFRHGFPAGGGGQLCIASEPYFTMFRDAILHHVKANGVDLIKLDNSVYYCNSTSHEHLPGKYSAEASFNRLIDIARAARAANPELFVIWYWGAYSPFFALHGDVLFDIRFSMEAASTGDFPALFFRDAANQGLDQGCHFAKWLPPRNHDSLGIWLADNSWGNFMETERWQEALILDLARGNLLFPQIWSDIYNLEEHDIEFLARMQALARRSERIFLTPRHEIGDPWKDQIYGYSYFEGSHGFIFLNNMSFECRSASLPLNPDIGFRSHGDGGVEMRAHHPVQAVLARNGHVEFGSGERIFIPMMPFEVMLLEVGSASVLQSRPPAQREISQGTNGSYRVPVRSLGPDASLEIHFADGTQLEGQGYRKRTAAFEARLPDYPASRHHVAVVCRFRSGGRPWRQTQMSRFVQAVASVEGRIVEFTRTPDYRQTGNQQWNSWIVFSAPLPTRFAGQTMRVGISSYLPEGTDMTTDLWVVKEWWRPRQRPLPNYWV